MGQTVTFLCLLLERSRDALGRSRALEGRCTIDHENKLVHDQRLIVSAKICGW